MFREDHPLAWSFHRNTSYWPYQTGDSHGIQGLEAPFKEYYTTPVIPLPAPADLAAPLQQAIAARLACRQFADTPVELGDLATMLHAAYGIQSHLVLGDQEFLVRPVPSGGALYPLEVYLLVRQVTGLAPGIYHYAVLTHALEQLQAIDLAPTYIADLFMGQSYVAQAGLIVVLTMVPARSMWKYADRGYRLILLEAGHLAQNLNLTAAALGLGSLNLGGFLDSELASLLALDLEGELPVYGIALGVPAGADPVTLRQY
ncbi:MAG TPA: SagB/ThcOx family dehydrogenase [Chloroflexia bacterium]|nr:SagB/ThcOx family dehydrogenase [Chloroflexia bacterium]